MSNSHRTTVSAAVNQQVDHVMKSTPFRGWLEKETLRTGELIVFDNSFLYRQKTAIKTTKSTKHLCVRVGDDGPTLPAYVVEPSVVIKSRFKRFPERGVHGISPQPLDDAIQTEIERLGIIVRTLIGKIGDDRPTSVPIEGLLKNFKVLAYQPQQSSTAEVSQETLCINRLDDVDTVWHALTTKAQELDLELGDKFAEEFEGKFASLRESAHRPVDVSVADHENSILGEVIHHIDRQIAAYSTALEAHLATPDHAEHLNDILRIAYNFADGAQQLRNLVVGVSDMKPVVFWLTLGAQSDLADRFAELPYSLVGKAKPSLEKYRSVIGSARNQSFHNIFSFARPFQVSLTGDAFQAAELHLFREYSSRNQPALSYSDQKLVDLLAGFTRTAESPAPRGFWEKNLEVMRATKSVAESLRSALIMLAVDH